MLDSELRKSCVNTIRFLAADAVEKAKSGHPGAPMGMADMAFVLWNQFLRYDPDDPDWKNRDRFVLSAGHASMLLYSLLHLAGYKLSMDELKNFRQWNSLTPGHPEYGFNPWCGMYYRSARFRVQQCCRHGARSKNDGFTLQQQRYQPNRFQNFCPLQ